MGLEFKKNGMGGGVLDFPLSQGLSLTLRLTHSGERLPPATPFLSTPFPARPRHTVSSVCPDAVAA